MNSSGYSYKLPEQGFKPASPGIHQAKIFQAISLGYQDGGKFKPTPRCGINLLLDEGTTLFHKFNPSPHKLGKFGPMVDAILSPKVHTELELMGFDLGSLIERVVTIQVKIDTTGAGKSIAKVATFLPAMGDSGNKIIPDDYAFAYPGMDPAQLAIELPKFPAFVQAEFNRQLTKAEYDVRLANWKIANPAPSKDVESSLA